MGRCLPIAKRIEEREAQVLFSTYKEGYRYAQQEKLHVVKVPPIDFVVKPDGTVDFKQSLVNIGPFLSSFTLLKQVEAEIDIMKAFKPDVVVSDSRASPLIAARLLGIPHICILNQFQIIVPRRTRFLRLARLADAGTLAIIGKMWTSGKRVLIPDYPEPYTLSAGNLRIPKVYQKRVRLIGPIIPVRPDELPSQKQIRKKLGLDESKPVIFAPISGPVKERAYFTGALRKIFEDFPEDYQIVMSLGYPNGSTKPVRMGNVTVYKWMHNRFEHLKACDLVVARAGHGTLAQSICYGKPSVLIPTPSHTEQLNNARRAVELGITEMIVQDKLDKQKLLGAIQRLLKDKRFKDRIKQIQEEVMKLDGIETAVQNIMEATEWRN
ncbi:MAG: UDP-N-acetylglucosamine--N-acetylmuramyl-(pentapeptide) pyrophosphoryl-undecaprenol N-acetylglucosamine transferase [Candidatus Bathyarchaeota archaeon]|nr:MAG: UDP-N-acetylglucosamine--N-acetylmuramyl-(pentapeptide) pyrophosphoryl-undecaprenol N-acetylglucosamine transferase [Candidatus Bathyarchaeota archaeon]